MKNKFEINDQFWGYYQDIVSDVMLPYQYQVLNDSLDDTDIAKSHSFENFRIAAGENDGEFYGCVFQDSDTAKWLEAVAYSLMINPDAELEKKADEIIALIGRAQEDDGYLNTYFIVKSPEEKWNNLQEGHELYCSGHMIEAGVAYYEATGKTTLLDIVKKNADLIYSIFGEDKKEGIPGHPEIELALVRLYRTTGDKRYLELSKYFIDQRGTNPKFFIEEREKRGWTLWNLLSPRNTDYAQNTNPVREEKDAVGHAVRAVYLYTGMAMVAKETGDETLFTACEKMWNSIVNKRMYITGGIGSSAEAGEAFTMDYDLPNDTAYNETCASVGLIFFAKEMLGLKNDAKYTDMMELALYNTVLAGIQRDGMRFFYTNPLEVNPIYARKLPGFRHVSAKRPKWHACACCPPNVARLLASLNRYAWHSDGNTVYSDLFIGGEYCHGDKISVTVETDYPYDGAVKYSIRADGTEVTLAIRIPFWSKNTTISVNGTVYDFDVQNGYAVVDGLQNNDEIILNIDITPHKVYANEKISADAGKCAMMAGPLVYCFEDADNGNIGQFFVDEKGEIDAVNLEDEVLGDINILKVAAYKTPESESLYSFKAPIKEKSELIAVPYYAWGNREEGKMRVWMIEK